MTKNVSLALKLLLELKNSISNFLKGKNNIILLILSKHSYESRDLENARMEGFRKIVC